MISKRLPWSLRSTGNFLSAYGDPFLFRGVRGTPPMPCNPHAATGLHTAVPHRYLLAYLVALKSFLRYCPDVAVYAHEDGSLTEADKDLIRAHVPGAVVVDRSAANERFAREVPSPLLDKVRRSYTSYIKLFDPTLVSDRERIILVDTDTLFLRRPQEIIDWTVDGTTPWYHRQPLGSNINPRGDKTKLQSVHIQALVRQNLDDINRELGTAYVMPTGFNSGFIGYRNGVVDFGKLERHFQLLYDRFSDRIFKWGAEQTTHALLLGEQGATALPEDDYFVFTHSHADEAEGGTFIHFVGESRFHRMIYPRLAAGIVAELRGGDAVGFERT